MDRMYTQVYDEAGEWVVRHRDDMLDIQARRRFDAWLRASPLHVRAYLEMSEIWELLSDLDPGRNAASEQLIAQAKGSANVVAWDAGVGARRPRAAAHVGKSGARTNLVFSLVATILLTVGVALWVHLQKEVYSTGLGEQRTIALLDGSSIELNSLSRVKVRFSDRKRSIELVRGQAFFRVAKDPKRPFIVNSHGTQVRAVGTEFDVYRKAAGTLVTVVEGRVSVRMASERPKLSPGARVEASAEAAAALADSRAATHERTPPTRVGEVLLVAGEQFLAAEAGRGGPPQVANVDAVTAWTQQRLVFDNTPLSEVTEEFNRYNRRPLVIEDPALRTLHVSGSFSSTDPSLLLRFLRNQPGIVVTETESRILISADGTL